MEVSGGMQIIKRYTVKQKVLRVLNLKVLGEYFNNVNCITCLHGVTHFLIASPNQNPIIYGLFFFSKVN